MLDQQTMAGKQEYSSPLYPSPSTSSKPRVASNCFGEGGINLPEGKKQTKPHRIRTHRQPACGELSRREKLYLQMKFNILTGQINY